MLEGVVKSLQTTILNLMKMALLFKIISATIDYKVVDSVDLTISQTSPGFYVSALQVLKTLWVKEKLLVTSNFFFSHSVFYPFGELSAIFIRFKIVVCKLFEFGRV